MTNDKMTLEHLLDPLGSKKKYNKVKYGDYLAHSLSKKVYGVGYSE